MFVYDGKATRITRTGRRVYSLAVVDTDVEMDPAGRIWHVACQKPALATATPVSCPSD